MQFLSADHSETISSFNYSMYKIRPYFPINALWLIYYAYILSNIVYLLSI